MDDLISRQAAIGSAISGMTMTIGGEKWIRVSEVRESLYSVPSAQRKGKWIAEEIGIITTSYRCSECGRVVWDDTGYDVVNDYPYCHCGAEMTKGEEDERIKNS